MTTPADTALNVAPGSTVVVRDEEWLVTATEQTNDGLLVHVQGLSELVRDTRASFFESLDHILPLDPALAQVIGDDSPKNRTARLWVEATLRKTPVPLTDTTLTVSPHMLADQLSYQATAIRQALDPDNLRPRILLADAVGLGKTIEIGMILSELVRRGRGERILIVSPKHVLEQMQNEMWSRFALPFVRLDSAGIQRVRQKLPSTRNPFTYYKRAIISIDTLKSDKYINYLRKQRWDAVVIDESHNLTNASTLNNRLARVLAPTADALILASATPHNGKAESFAELVRLLEPTAVRPDGTIIEDEAKRLIIRRHRHSPEVASAVGADWAPRKEPQHLLVPASPQEDAVAQELDATWLHPSTGGSPYSGKQDSLFGWTLAKAYLSSPVALDESISNRLKILAKSADAGAPREREALQRLQTLNAGSLTSSAKYRALVDYLKGIGVSKTSPERAVVFAERLATLHYLRENLPKDLGLRPDAVEVMHGGLTDETQQQIIESFKQSSSPIRVLVTGDVASEGVNLHTQCHELIHFDIPWSLIRIEQRNGRIDRYGQKHPPQITTLLLDPSSGEFKGDLRVLKRLLDREHEAHQALGDTAHLMGQYSAEAEEDEIRKVLAGKKDFDDVVKTADAAVAGAGEHDFLATLLQMGNEPVPAAQVTTAAAHPVSFLYPDSLTYLTDAVHEAIVDPSASPDRGGIGWRVHAEHGLVEFTPPADLRQRLDALPQAYLVDRKVKDSFKLATSKHAGKNELARALADQNASSWPEAHFLGPLHPVLEWATDRALGKLARNSIFAIRGQVEEPTVLLVGTLTNKRGHVVASAHMSALFPQVANPNVCFVSTHQTALEMLDAAGVTVPAANAGALAHPEALTPLIATAVHNASAHMEGHLDAARTHTNQRVDRWASRATEWEAAADVLIQRAEIKQRRVSVETMEQIAQGMRPDRFLVRPLLVVVPQDFEVGAGV